MPRTIHLPKQRALMAAPELAALTLLEAAANIATVALAASHPDLKDASELSDDPQLAFTRIKNWDPQNGSR